MGGIGQENAVGSDMRIDTVRFEVRQDVGSCFGVGGSSDGVGAVGEVVEVIGDGGVGGIGERNGPEERVIGGIRSGRAEQEERNKSGRDGEDG